MRKVPTSEYSPCKSVVPAVSKVPVVEYNPCCYQMCRFSCHVVLCDSESEQVVGVAACSNIWRCGNRVIYIPVVDSLVNLGCNQSASKGPSSVVCLCGLFFCSVASVASNWLLHHCTCSIYRQSLKRTKRGSNVAAVSSA